MKKKLNSPSPEAMAMINAHRERWFSKETPEQLAERRAKSAAKIAALEAEEKEEEAAFRRQEAIESTWFWEEGYDATH
ncbi:hypothetical protein DO97_16265 [Neosynechococcus sphagnicola sy1]|uniref:Uncharacterized protein n=1 Tax=Neosynechococcus sphagnicola sy1 TaxID=1497020 RepID=A0A098THV8_9CYAN|nr:hypothetical protein [Neosynechococcus sphagnicola]KGF71689.1 hypothetical protein DO97_16265 [Neosynechococcus sphagnicola sy1]